jgi:F420-dependent oxidoreductase-like protein
MRFAYWPGSTHPWQDVLALSKHAESSGWDRLYYCDHFMPNTPDASGPFQEVWTVVSALAAAIPRIEIGTMVLGNTYRHPAVVAKMAATLDHVSGGRAVLGIGAGWQENEHRAYGLPFYTLGERLGRLEEACAIIRSLLDQPRTTFAGKYYQLENAPLEPKPVQRRLPLLVGGGGEKVTLRIAGRYADEWNVWGNVETLKHKIEILERHTAAAGRKPHSVKRSAVALLHLSDDRAYIEGVRANAGSRPVIAGNVEEVRAIVAAYAAAGVDELIVPDFNLGPREKQLPVLDRFIREVAPVAR